MSDEKANQHGPKRRRIRYRLPEDTTPGVAFKPLNCNNAGYRADQTWPPSGTTFVDRGAQKLTHVHVQLIFWGTEWAGIGKGLSGLVTNAVQSLLGGPYMTYLAQYGVHRGSLRGTTYATAGNPPLPFSYADVGNFIISQLDADNLPEPDSDWPIVYAVIMPSTAAFQGDPRVENLPLPPGVPSAVAGSNSSIIWNDYDLGDVDNDPAYYFWVGNNGSAATQANVDYITTVLSHELVELATDPNGGNGIVQVGGGGATSQIGDPCTGNCDYVRGVKAQAYWAHNLGDKTNGTCVLPKVYAVRRTLADRNIGGRIGSLQNPIPSLNKLITSLF